MPKIFFPFIATEERSPESLREVINQSLNCCLKLDDIFNYIRNYNTRKQDILEIQTLIDNIQVKLLALRK